MGFPPDHRSEGVIYARHILATESDPRIAVLMQNDDFGKDLLSGLKEGLGGGADKIVRVARYEVADPTVDSQIIQLKGSGANVLVNIATAKFAAQAIRKAAEIGWKPAHYLSYVSASVGAVMEPAGLENAQGIITAAFVKDPTDPQWAQAPDFLEWKAFMQKHYPGGSVARFENAYAYAAASLLTRVLKQCGDDLTRANVMRQAARLKDVELPMLLPGIRVNTDPSDYFPIQSVRLQRFKGQTWELFGGVISSEAASQ